MLRQILLAFQFLTIVPIRVDGEISEREIAQAAAFFPLVGAFQGVLAALSASLLMKVFSPEITGGLLLLVAILSNGGFDLDGLADSADALAVKSTGDAQTDRLKRLAVMKDSTIGAMGVLALIMAILLKFLFIRQLLADYPVSTCASLLFLMPVFSKWITVPMMLHGTPARQDGLGKIFLDHVTVNTVVLSSLLLAVLFIAAAELYLLGVYGPGIVELFIVLFAMFYLCALFAVRYAAKRFGGITGDHCGAMSEIADILYLAVITLWLPRSI